MQSINTLSLTPEVNNWLANTRHPRILHVFNHACNLINEHKEVLSIVTPQIGNGPFNLVLEEDILLSEYLTIESSISILGDQLTLGDLLVNIADAKLWSPRPDWKRLRAKKDYIAKQLMKLQIFNNQMHGLTTGFARSPQPYSTTSINQNVPIANYQFSISLRSALASADLTSSRTATQKLAGLGNGLTPAGDDFIMGAIYAAWIIHPFEVAEALAGEIANTAAPLTTSLSAAWLRSAGSGDAGVLWHQFFNALISSDPVQVQNAMDRILATGETSGEDALSGFFSTLICWAEMELRRLP